MRILSLLAALALLWGATGCSTSTTSTTPRTAVEMALISEAAERCLGQLRAEGEIPYETFTIDDSQFEATDEEFMLSALKLYIMRETSLAYVADAEAADVVVYPRAAVAALDESRVLLGMPEIPVPVPGVGVLNTPELALFGTHKQIGRARLGAFAVDADTGRLVADMGIHAARTRYTRWRILFFISFATTDLGPPYDDTPKSPNPFAD